jgi:peptidoglycan hydrolase-like protein with peptidoglycan-binding domain
MSNLFKSKILLGVFAIALMFAVAGSAMAADGAVTKTLRQGMRDVQVKYLQQTLNESGYTVAASGRAGSMGMETTYFGPATTAAAKAFQAAKGLVADGIFGPISRSALVANGGVSGNFPAGCQSAAGYSPTTGAKCDSLGNTGTPVATGPVTVALSSDTPASGSVISPSTGAVFAKFLFTGNGTVTSIKLMRTGISSNTALPNIFLYDGSTRLTDGASLGSDNTATFNAPGGLFTVTGSKVISVVADVTGSDYSVGLNLTSVTSGGTATAVNIAGNVQYIAVVATPATVAMSSALGSGNTDAGVDLTVWQGTATVGTRDHILKSLALRQTGSIVASDIKNFKLYVDGILVNTVASLDSNGYVTFATSTVLKTGARILKVTADVIGGAGRTVQFSLRGAYDIQATDTQYNANTLATGTFPFGPSAFTVNPGTMTIVKKTDSPSANVTLGASDQNLASYTFTAYGEPIKVETLRVGMITNNPTNVSLRNTRIVVNGAQVGSNTAVPAAAAFAADSGTSFTTNFVVYPGTPATVEIHADLYDSNTTGGDEIGSGSVTSVQAVLVAVTSGNAVPQTSLGTILVPATSNKAGNNLTISQGSMSLALTSNYANRLTAIPTSAYKIGSFQLTGSATEAINLNTIYVGWTTASTVVEPTELSDLYVVYGGTQTAVKGTVVGSATSATASDNSNSWSINRTLAKNETMQIDVYATIAGTLTGSGVINATLAVAGTTASSGIATYADASGTTSLTAGFTGQTVTGSTGTLVLSNDASTALAQIVDDNTTVKTLSAKFVAVTDAYTVTDMTVTVSDASAVSSVTVKDHATGAVIGAAKPGATSITWSGLTLDVAAGSTKIVDVELALGTVGVGGGSTGSLLTTGISAFTARNSAGTNGVGTSGTASGNPVYVYKAIPTVSLLTLPTSVLAAGTQTLAKFSVNSGGTGTIAWNRIIFSLTKTTTPTVASVTLWTADSNTQITTGTVTLMDTVNATACGGAVTACRVLFIPSSEQQVAGSANYALKATVGGAVAATDYISTSIAAPSVFAASTDYVTVAASGSFAATYAGYGTTPSFIWSDVSASSHATTVSTDWSNDYLVRTLPLDSQTVSK